MKADREIKVRCAACGHLTRIPTVTNADRIRSMTDEELARFIADKQAKGYNDADHSEEFAITWLEWLRKECDG